MKVMSDLKTTTTELTVSEVFLLNEALEIVMLKLGDSPMEGESDEAVFNRILAKFTIDLHECTDDVLTKIAEVL